MDVASKHDPINSKDKTMHPTNINCQLRTFKHALLTVISLHVLITEILAILPLSLQRTKPVQGFLPCLDRTIPLASATGREVE